MTGEPDNKLGRRPPTIELKATEVENPAPVQDTAATGPAGERVVGRDVPDQPSANQQASGNRAPDLQAGGSSGSRLKSHAIAAAAGAIAIFAIMAAIIAGLWLAGLMPSREAAAPPSAAALGAAGLNVVSGEQISARLDKIERTIQAQRPEPALGNRLAAAEAQTKALGDSLSAVNRRVDDIAATSQSAAKQAEAAAAAAAAAKNAEQSVDQTNAQRSDLEALASRIAALESAVKSLADDEARHAPSADDQAARLAVAAEALRAAVERGVPYQAELAAVQSLGANQNTTAPLEPFAASGVPGANALGHELGVLVPALERAADTATGETTFLGRLEVNAQRLVRVTPVEAPAGNDPAAIVARIAVDAARADIAAALDDIADLPAALKPLAAEWVKKAQTREAAIAASRHIAAAALAAVSKPAAQ